jgi:hypothetical protein
MTEASLDQLLAEPITRLVMQRDGVSEGDIRRLMAYVAAGRRRQLGEARKVTFHGQKLAD